MKREDLSLPTGSLLREPEAYLQDRLTHVWSRIKRSRKDLLAYTELQPEKALLWAAGGGYLLRLLPLKGILGTLIRIVLALLKPVALFYGGVKAWQKAEPFINPRATSRSL